MTWFILGSYFGILSLLCIYGAHRLWITAEYRKNAGKRPEPKERFDELPEVLLQLPLFNEKFVVERLIDASIEIDYPKDKLHIQVLDDSTDETCRLAREKVEHYRKRAALQEEKIKQMKVQLVMQNAGK